MKKNFLLLFIMIFLLSCISNGVSQKEINYQDYNDEERAWLKDVIESKSINIVSIHPFFNHQIIKERSEYFRLLIENIISKHQNSPPNPPLIEGNKTIKINEKEMLSFLSTDPEGDQISYLIEWADGSYGDNKDYSNLKIAPPPGGGIYLGQYEWRIGDIHTFEEAIGKKVAWFSPYGVMEYDQYGYPHFDPVNAERSWKEGKIVLVHAIEADPDPKEGNAEGMFTIDKLCKGTYDEYLSRLADQFRSFGKPMLFHTCREPLGIGFDYIGGFGPEGDKSTLWAMENKRGFNEFDPSVFPNAHLYHDLGDPEVCDGVERLIAAQRYYYHFFVEKEGLDFLSFDTMGWGCVSPEMINDEIQEYLNGTNLDPDYVQRMYENCYDFEKFYPGDDYVDWISINYYGFDWRILGIRLEVPMDYLLDGLMYTMNAIKETAPDKPVYFLEFGFADGMRKDSEFAAEKIQITFDTILSNYPEINGFSMWSYHPFWHWIFPFDCLIRPGTAQANTLRSIIENHESYFYSTVYFTDGTKIPYKNSEEESWIGPFVSGEPVFLNNMWFDESEITIRAKAKDSKGAESDWSTYELAVSNIKINKNSI
jgi:hypothetical protein